MPLTFTAPIEELAEPAALALPPPMPKPQAVATDAGSASPWTDRADRDWTPAIATMTAEQATTLKRLAAAAYERDAYKPRLTCAEASRRIAMLVAKLKLLDAPPHTL